MEIPEISTEIRWFLSRPTQKDIEQLKNWVNNIPSWRETPEDDERRDDMYLITLGNTCLSPKLRGGKLEIKYLENPEDTKEIFGPDAKPIGLGQIWHKWKWRYVKEEKKKNKKKGQFLKKFNELVAVGFLEKTSKELRFNVAKTRTQRKFKDKNGELEPVQMSEKNLPYGFLAEVTQLEVDKKQWYTVAVEMFGNPDHDQPMNILQKGVNWLFRNYEGPTLQVNDSYSYPEWLTKI